MIEFDAAVEMPVTARYHREAIEQIVHCVEEGVICALLGPRLCGKTLLLRFIESKLAPLLGWTCIYIDLQELRATTQMEFFADLARLTAAGIQSQSGKQLTPPDEQAAGSAVYRAFLSECLEEIRRDLVLIIDPLEALPTDLAQALLTSLRAAYMDQRDLDYQVTVVVSGALSLATLAVGESSPFRGIARHVFVGDLSEEESQAMILEFLGDQGVSITAHALRRLLRATSGDTYLIRRICQRGAELVNGRSGRLLRSRDVAYITDRFLRDEVYQYAPLLEAIRLIEEDPDLLECILRLLEHERVPRSALPLPLSPDLDPLYLTGVIEIVDRDDYRLQNSIYRCFLEDHFTPGQVGHVLVMAGRWDAAIDYLEASIQQGSRQARADVLPATINSIYAAQDLQQAVHFLQRGLAAAFGVRESQIWYAPAQENHLQLIGLGGVNLGDNSLHDLQIALTADRLETRAYRQRLPLRGQEGEQRVVRAIPLIIPGSRPIGVVTIYDDVGGERRERDLQMVGFLNQAARALHTVSVRRQELALAGRLQASLMPLTPPPLAGWQITATWRPARETSGDFFDFIALPNGRLGIVIADVVDKGMGAALLMALSRTLIRTYALEFSEQPDLLLKAANQRIITDIGGSLFVTLFYGVLEPSTGRLVYCNAGHPPPYLLHPGGEQGIELLYRTGMPLGIADDAVWGQEVAQIPEKGLLLLYTDGVTDARNQGGELFGEKQVLNSLQAHGGRGARQVQDALLSAVLAFAGSEPQADDITLMVLARQEAEKPRVSARTARTSARKGAI